MVLNKETKRVCLNPFNGYKAPTEHYEDELHLPTKCVSDETTKVEDRLIRYSDIDLNGHLNNTKYIDYILDMHTPEFYKHNFVSHIVINYEKEILGGDVVDLYSNSSNPEYINGSVGDKIIFEAEVEYSERD